MTLSQRRDKAFSEMIKLYPDYLGLETNAQTIKDIFDYAYYSALANQPTVEK